MRWSLRLFAATVAVCAGNGFSPALGQGELAKLLAGDPELEDYFGQVVAISGNVAVVGMQYDDDSGENSGAAYVFRGDGLTWTQEAKLVPDDPARSDLFGCSVAIAGDAIVVGAREDDDNGVSSGSAYAFRYDPSSETWVQEAKLLPDDGTPDDLFGSAVAISGNAALVARPGINADGQYHGSAYVFRFNGVDWLQEAKLSVSDGAEADLFGANVALDGDVALIAAPYDDENGHESGSVYVFRFDGADWVEEQKITPTDGAANDFFGCSAAVSGNTILIGAYQDDDNADDSGSAYVFVYDGVSWVQRAKLVASDAAANDAFGASVALFGETAVVGAPYDDESGDNSGSAYVFHFDGSDWSEQAKLLASDGAMWDLFGSTVAVSEILPRRAVIGALRDDDDAINGGSAYVFDVTWCLGDLDHDNDVDLADLAQLLANYGTTSGAVYEDGDLDGDGDVDLADISALLAKYRTTCE